MAKPRRAPAPAEAQIAFWGLVTATHGRHHWVKGPDGTLYEAHRRGKKSDVVAGDIVGCTAPAGATVAIESVRERRNLLFRSDELRVKELAANVDLVAVVFASRPTFNPWFVWRAIIAAKTAGIPCLAIRNKTDLPDEGGAAERFLSELQSIGEQTVSVCAQGDAQMLRAQLLPHFSGKTTLLIGQSGMGKSTILNALVPQAMARTREFSEALDIGKQTTTDTRLYEGEADGKTFSLIDSPGFQEFGLKHVTPDDILRAMPDILGKVDGCRFYNCTHTTEPGCSVLAALKRGEISEARHEFYCSLAKNAGR
jgi:ribosome biogenesis GTPase